MDQNGAAPLHVAAARAGHHQWRRCCERGRPPTRRGAVDAHRYAGGTATATSSGCSQLEPSTRGSGANEVTPDDARLRSPMPSPAPRGTRFPAELSALPAPVYGVLSFSCSCLSLGRARRTPPEGVGRGLYINAEEHYTRPARARRTCFAWTR